MIWRGLWFYLILAICSIQMVLSFVDYQISHRSSVALSYPYVLHFIIIFYPTLLIFGILYAIRIRNRIPRGLVFVSIISVFITQFLLYNYFQQMSRVMALKISNYSKLDLSNVHISLRESIFNIQEIPSDSTIIIVTHERLGDPKDTGSEISFEFGKKNNQFSLLGPTEIILTEDLEISIYDSDFVAVKSINGFWQIIAPEKNIVDSLQYSYLISKYQQ